MDKATSHDYTKEIRGQNKTKKNMLNNVELHEATKPRVWQSSP